MNCVWMPDIQIELTPTIGGYGSYDKTFTI